MRNIVFLSKLQGALPFYLGVEKQFLLFTFFSCYIIFTFVMGGANENHFIANALLQYLSAPILTVSLYTLLNSESPGISKKIITFGLILLLIFLIMQLAPLPEGIWKVLPFHDLAAKGLSVVGVAHPTGPLSLDPNMTWVSLLSLIPPLAIFFGFLTFDTREQNAFILLILACGIVNAFLGFVQLSQNSENGSYIYPNASAGELLGFFKNRNHFAALMYSLLPFATVVSANALTTNIQVHRRNNSAMNIPLLVFGLSSLFIFTVACVMARSRAAVILLMISLVSNAFLPRWKYLSERLSFTRKKFNSRIMLAIVLFSLLFAIEFGFSRLLARFDVEPLQDARVNIAKNTSGAVLQAFPYGTGLGTFQKIYAVIQPLRDTIPHKFANRAHNDYLEFALEAGLFGILIIFAFLLWYGLRFFYLWFQSKSEGMNQDLSRAASISIGLLLLHSLVDYPLRTHALMGLFAICCALLLTKAPRINETERQYQPVHKRRGQKHQKS